ncbi:MAG: condensation domain-containing protein, partial [Blastocatellia bacterium]
RYTGQTDIALGTPIANRGSAQLEGLIGLFVNTLVLRSRISPGASMRDLIQEEKRVALDAYAHQNVPFEKLVEDLQPERSLTRNPLFEVMFNFVNTPAQAIELAGLSLSSVGMDETQSKLPLTLYAQEQGDRLILTARYRRSLFSREAITSLLSQFQFFLEQVAADISKAADTYSLVSPGMQDMLPDPRALLDEPHYEPITVTFSRVTAAAPDQHAVARGAHCWSYGQLAERSQALACQLIAAGIERGDVIAVFGPRSFGLITGMLAGLMTGGVLLTLDPGLPILRLQRMISLAGVRRIVYVGVPGADDEWLIETGLTVTFVDPETGSRTEEAAAFEGTT